MATKPPPSVQEFPPDSTEKIAYESVKSIPTQEPNDQNRLGYHVWRWLKDRRGTLDEAIAESGARLSISRREARAIIAESLAQRGITAS